MLVLHRYMVAISRETLNYDDGDGSIIDPLVWDKGHRAKSRKTGSRLIERPAGLPGPPAFLMARRVEWYGQVWSLLFGNSPFV